MTCRNALGIALVAATVGLGSCCNKHDSPNVRIIAKAGLFYGGQIQNRTEWPLILDATRQTQGFRIEFVQPLLKPSQVHWEVTRVVARPKKRSTAPDDTSNPVSNVVVPAGSQRFDQVISFSDSDRPGDWKLKVVVDGVSVLDKTIHVIPKPASSAED